MIIKKAKWKKEKRVVSIPVHGDVYGCDCCKKEISKDKNPLEVRAFFKNDEPVKDYQFCSWDCVIKYIPKVKCDFFADLPFLHFDKQVEGRRFEDFLKAINKGK